MKFRIGHQWPNLLTKPAAPWARFPTALVVAFGFLSPASAIAPKPNPADFDTICVLALPPAAVVTVPGRPGASVVAQIQFGADRYQVTSGAGTSWFLSAEKGSPTRLYLVQPAGGAELAGYGFGFDRAGLTLDGTPVLKFPFARQPNGPQTFVVDKEAAPAKPAAAPKAAPANAPAPKAGNLQPAKPAPFTGKRPDPKIWTTSGVVLLPPNSTVVFPRNQIALKEFVAVVGKSQYNFVSSADSTWLTVPGPGAERRIFLVQPLGSPQASEYGFSINQPGLVVNGEANMQHLFDFQPNKIDTVTIKGK